MEATEEDHGPAEEGTVRANNWSDEVLDILEADGTFCDALAVQSMATELKAARKLIAQMGNALEDLAEVHDLKDGYYCWCSPQGFRLNGVHSHYCVQANMAHTAWKEYQS